jgi:hypothetical protein
MPKRTSNHIVADIAVAKVQDVLTSCGWTCEVVQKDYGEDLMVQTHYHGRVDPNKIWIQVKGTRDLQKRSKSSSISITIPIDHVLKWLRSSETVIVVLWDIKRNAGLWTMPKNSLKEWDIIQSEHSSAKLVFDSSAAFDKDAAIKLAWMARLDHYNTLIAKALNDDLLFYRDSSKKKEEIKAYKSRVPLLAFDFLRLIGVITNEGIDIGFRRILQNAQKRLGREFPKKSDQDLRNMAGFLAVLISIQRVSSCGVPESVHEACWNVVSTLMTRIDMQEGKVAQ